MKQLILTALLGLMPVCIMGQDTDELINTGSPAAIMVVSCHIHIQCHR